MTTYVKGLFACALLALCARASLAQESATVTARTSAITTLASEHERYPITGQPYSATTESESVQTLADGTHVDRKMSTTRTYRDSQGRTRLERYMPANLAKPEEKTLLSVVIRDPVAGVEYFLNPRDHTAREVARPTPTGPPSRQDVTETPLSLGSPQHSGSARVAEPLGTQVMDGFAVDGEKTTLTIPTGAQGNDQPISIVTERWFSKELQLYILVKNSDPRSGENTIRTTNIDRSEPDPSLFQVPPDYTITQK